MVEFYVEPNTTTIPLGRQGENLARTIYFELSELISNYGEGTATLVCLRPSDTAPYVCETTQTGAMLAWTPTNTDTAFAGGGKCELRWVVGDTLAKSIIYTTTIAPSITGAGEVPSPYKSWYDAIISYIEANYAANGAPQEVREAIYTLLSKAAYTETGLTDELAIVQAWTAETISVTNNLTHVTNSNPSEMISHGDSYTATLSATSGYTLSTVTVTMGGEDITATVYSSGTITIPSVTGNIVITATAVAAVSSLSAVYTQSGTVYDTDTLDTLKSDLVVTATYGDSSTAVIPSTNYTLSGTLAVGTSTITVSYGGKTATFNVTVTEQRYIPAQYTWLYDPRTDGLLSNYEAVTVVTGGNGGTETITDNQLVLQTAASSSSQSNFLRFNLSDATTTNAVLSCVARIEESFSAAANTAPTTFRLQLSNGTSGAQAYFLLDSNDNIEVAYYEGTTKKKVATNFSKNDFHLFELSLSNGVQSLSIDGTQVFESTTLSTSYCTASCIFNQAGLASYNPNGTLTTVDWISYYEVS